MSMAMRRFKFNVFSVRVILYSLSPFRGIFPRERRFLSILDTEYSSELCWSVRDVILEQLYRARSSRFSGFLEQE